MLPIRMRERTTPLMTADKRRAPDARNAVLLIDKPEGMTSFEAVEAVRRAVGADRAGHAGTIDRFASGLLIVCTGKATKLSRLFLEEDKCYTGTMRLGVTTDTDEPEGTIIDVRPVATVTIEDIREKASGLTGSILQVPPVYSALKVKGKRASDRVRGGEKIALPARQVIVYDFTADHFDRDNGRLAFTVRCSKGTYVRALARDLGAMLGTGACLETLRRTAIGSFRVEDALPPSDIPVALAARGTREPRFLLRPAEALNTFGRIVVDDSAMSRIIRGASISEKGTLRVERGDGERYIIVDKNENLIAIADVDLRKWHVKYLNVFSTPI